MVNNSHICFLFSSLYHFIIVLIFSFTLFFFSAFSLFFPLWPHHHIFISMLNKTLILGNVYTNNRHGWVSGMHISTTHDTQPSLYLFHKVTNMVCRYYKPIFFFLLAFPLHCLKRLPTLKKNVALVKTWLIIKLPSINADIKKFYSFGMSNEQRKYSENTEGN